MVKITDQRERKLFQACIFASWDDSKHNFSRDENGFYVYQHMEDAWNVWLRARLSMREEMDEQDDRK